MKSLITENKKIYYGLLVISALIILLVSLRHISELINIMAWDELGYWGNGAHIAGYDWSSVVSTYAGYYSYGYSLILAVLLKIFDNAHTAYQVAIAINAVFNTGSFLLTNYVGIKCFNWNNKYYVLFTSYITSIYVNNITQSNCAWTECELIFLYWCLTTLFLEINKKYKLYKLLLILVLSVYMYCVHNRTVGILIASMITIILLILVRKIPKKDIILSLIIISSLVIAETVYKVSIKQNVYVNKADGELVNTVAATAPWIVSKFQSLYGIIDLIKTFFNRFLYFEIITFGVFLVYFIHAVQKIYINIKKKEIDFFNIFVILSMLGIFGIMTLQLSQSGSYQALLYGRYQDIIIGPLFLLGMMCLISKANNNIIYRYVFITPILIWVLLGICRSIPIYNDYFVPNCNVSLYKFWIGTENGGYNFNRMFILSTLLTAFFAVICHINMHNRKLGLILLVFFSITYGASQIRDSETVYNSFFNNYHDMSNELSEIHNICKEEKEIYYYNDQELSITIPIAMWLQLEMYDHKIIVVNDLQNLVSHSHLVVPRRKISDTDYVATIQVGGQLISDYKFAALYIIE